MYVHVGLFGRGMISLPTVTQCDRCCIRPALTIDLYTQVFVVACDSVSVTGIDEFMKKFGKSCLVTADLEIMALNLVTVSYLESPSPHPPPSAGRLRGNPFHLRCNPVIFPLPSVKSMFLLAHPSPSIRTQDEVLWQSACPVQLTQINLNISNVAR